MKKASKYSIGSVFYLPTIKQYVMVVTPVEAGTVVYVVSAGDVSKVMKYNIRKNKLFTNYCETCQKNKKLSPRASK
jgi:hypothetical protein